MMDPSSPTTHVWHAYYGDLVVVAAPGVAGMEERTKQLTNMKGPGTWTITKEAHVRSLRTMRPDGEATVSADDFRWVPWSELKLRG